MNQVTLKGNPVTLSGALPEIGSRAPELKLTTSTLHDVGLNEWADRKKLLSIFPSIDTGVCSLSTQKFNEYAKRHNEMVMLMISADLPFAHDRFCGNSDVENVVMLSTMRNPNFAKDYGVRMEDGPLRGLMARAIVVLDENNTVIHAQLVDEITSEPDYRQALLALGIDINEEAAVDLPSE